MIFQPLRRTPALKLDGRPFRSRAPMQDSVLRRRPLLLPAALALARLAKVDDFRHARGPIIFSGRTNSSNSSAVTKPPPTASSRRVVPFLCAALAIAAALS